MTEAPLSESIQDYLKGIYKLQAAGERVTITAVARNQGVSAASASAMVKKLAALDLLEHEPYRGARLTDAGSRVAVEVIRHHRLIELYLAETLGLSVDAVLGLSKENGQAAETISAEATPAEEAPAETAEETAEASA